MEHSNLEIDTNNEIVNVTSRSISTSNIKLIFKNNKIIVLIMFFIVVSFFVALCVYSVNSSNSLKELIINILNCIFALAFAVHLILFVDKLYNNNYAVYTGQIEILLCNTLVILYLTHIVMFFLFFQSMTVLKIFGTESVVIIVALQYLYFFKQILKTCHFHTILWLFFVVVYTMFGLNSTIVILYIIWNCSFEYMLFVLKIASIIVPSIAGFFVLFMFSRQFCKKINSTILQHTLQHTLQHV